MDSIRITGGARLKGQVKISGAKNAALPLMAVGLLTEDKFILQNAPQLADIATMGELLQGLGATVARDAAGDLVITAKDLTSYTAPYEMVRKMRASIVVLGPLLARAGEAKVSLPGGCAIGARPVDLHIEALKALGAQIELCDGYIDAKAPQGLKGARFNFPKISVTGTENLMMAAALAKGTTIIGNAAREPEIIDLGVCLNAMGAQLEGLGTDTIIITGVERLHGAIHSVVPDRIETGTYIAAAGITHGELELIGARAADLGAAIAAFERAGMEFTETATGLISKRRNGLIGADAMTEPYPGFPTDLQAQFMTLMTVAQGASMITETIFENRFMHVPELARMGADITIHHSSALVRGVAGLKGAPVMATDLRASVSLILAGLVANGTTTVSRIYHLDRGYEKFEEKLAACGASIVREHDVETIS